MTDRELMQQALEALDGVEALLTSMDVTHLLIYGEVDKAITALRDRKAQPEEEPVALETVYETIIHWDEGGGKRSRRELARRIVDLYTTPPQRKPEQALVIDCPRCGHCCSQKDPMPLFDDWDVFAGQCPPCNQRCEQGRLCPARGKP